MRFFLLALALSSAASTASAHPDVDRLFEESFHQLYVSNHCGTNIRKFLTLAHERGLDVQRAQIVQIENNGATTFGMVNAEQARNQGDRLPAPTPSGLKFAAGETNWYFHVVLELDGKIYDFDYRNQPTVTSIDDYVRKMFLDERTREQGGKFYAAPEKKLSEYLVTLQRASDYFARQQRPQLTKISLAEFVK